MEDSASGLENTLDDDIWKDTFDKLFDKRSILREQKVIKPYVRASFNDDSSVENTPDSIGKPISLDGSRSNDNEDKISSGLISTPLPLVETRGHFECPLSPISSWRLNYLPIDSWSSPLLKKSLIKNKNLRYSLLKSSPLAQKPLSIPKITITDSNSEIDVSIVGSLREINESENDPSVEIINKTVILPPGKWRRSLSCWKKNYQIKNEPLNRSPQIEEGKQILRRTQKRSTQRQDNLLKACKQNAILPFSSVYPDCMFTKCRKIGEGTYGEVFLNVLKDEETVIKIIPIEGDVEFNGEPQKTFEEIYPEVVITAELSRLREHTSFRTTGFVFLKKARCIKGKYPKHFIDLWNAYDRNFESENDHPEMFKNDQVYVALEIANGGQDLEKFPFRNAEQAYAAFSQIAISLAVAEKHLEFEHRDLHWGNVLIKATKQKFIEYVINNKDIKISTNGIEVTIIDYTLSRMLLSGNCYFNDLANDEDLFCAKGDYQYDIYRLMKIKLQNNWKNHEPQTNIMWLHYILTKFIDEVRYKAYRTKQHKNYMQKLNILRDSIMANGSVYEFVNKTYR